MLSSNQRPMRNHTPSLRSTSVSVWLLTILWLTVFLSSTQVSAQLPDDPSDYPARFRGVSADSVYTVGEVDSINLFNGNLSLSVPIGPEMIVSSHLSYRISANYNSHAWDLEDKDTEGHPYICERDDPSPDNTTEYVRLEVPEPMYRSSAGVGWEVSMGRLFKPDQVVFNENNPYWIYASPDGGRTPLKAADIFFSGQDKVWMSFDGSFLRLTSQLNGTPGCHEEDFPVTGCKITLEFSDGTIHRFENIGTFLAQDWRPVKYEDRFGNAVDISYEGKLWRIKDYPNRDTTARTQMIQFFDDSYSRVDKIFVKTFQGQEEYQFFYSALEVERHMYRRTREHLGCFEGSPSNVSNTVTAQFLTRIQQPDGSNWYMHYYTTDPGTGGTSHQKSGAIQRFVMPSGGEYHYEYGLYPFQFNFLENPAYLPTSIQETWGVVEKQRQDSGGVDLGTWTYEPGFATFPSPPDVQPNGFNFVPCFFSRKVVDPLGHYEISYFQTAQNRVETTRQNLPYTFCNPDYSLGSSLPPVYNLSADPSTWEISDYPPGGAFLSKRIYNNDDELLREVWVEYDHENIANSTPFQHQHRRRLERVKYFDDTDDGTATGTPYTRETRWENYDGLGHFRRTVIDGTFPNGQNQLTQTVNYNPDVGTWDPNDVDSEADTFTMPAPSDPWVLDLYDEVRLKQGTGDESRTLFCFDEATGFLLGQRRTENANSLSADDVVMAYTQSSTWPGEISQELYDGGDNDATGTSADDPCAVNGDASYRIDHDYASAIRHYSAFKDVNSGAEVQVLLDQDIHFDTGLVSAQRNAGGVETTYDYDVFGRLTAEKPANSAWTKHQYINHRRYDTRQCVHGVLDCSGDATLAEQRFFYDGFGKLLTHQRRMPKADGTTYLSEKTFKFNHLDFMTEETGWRDTSVSGFNFKTRYQNYDRFGRAGKVLAPDNTYTTFDFSGDRRVESQLFASSGGSSLATRVEARDTQGRLVLVQEQSDSGTDFVNTTYEYDEAGRLDYACVGDADTSGTVCGSPGQQRRFNYDGRGFKEREEHPEMGTAGNTDRWVRFTAYDALGNPLFISRSGDALDLTHVYDGAGRLTQVNRPESGTEGQPGFLPKQLLQEFFYRGASEACRGSLHSTKQHHHHTAVPSEAPARVNDLVVTETFRYDADDDCRLATYGVRSSHDDAFRGALFRTDFSWDGQGNLVAIDYPQCIGPGCSGLPTAQVTSTFTQGLLTAVGGAAGLSYHPTGQVNTVSHVNGVTDTMERLSNAWKPVHRLVSSGFSNADDWEYGPFTFDAAQNVTQIETLNGNETFAYDRVHRLVNSTVQTASGAQTQQMAYDIYGNLTSLITAGETESMAFGTPNRNRLTSHGASYDAAGALRGIELGGVSYTYDRDPLQRITRLRASGVDRTHLYTSGGERFATLDLIAEEESWTVRDPGQRLLSRFARRDGLTFEWQKDYMHGSDRPLATAVSNGSGGELVRHLHVDHLSSVRRISDSNGQLVTRNDFFPFGGYTAPPVTGTEELQFTGHERDDLGGNLEGHLDYMHARYYTPQLGRFLSMDPAERSMDPAVPQSWNRYTYAMDNPLRYRDPDGEAVETPWDALNVGIGVASLGANLASGNFGGALLDAVGLAYDATATAVPGLPAGASTVIKANRARRLFSSADNVASSSRLPRACFPAGTLVSTTTGRVPIEEVEAGQMVACADTTRASWTFCEVEEPLRYDYTGTVVTLVADGEIVQATGDHPFWVVSGSGLLQRPVAVDAGQDAWVFEDHGRWVEAEDIEIGDTLWLNDGRHVQVTSTVSFDATLPVFNLRVADLQTYSVGPQGVLVHNRARIASKPVRSKIREHPFLVREAKRTGRKQQRGINKLEHELLAGNLNPGKGTKAIGNGILAARHQNGARVYFRVTDEAIEILGKSDKGNQQAVIDFLREIYK